MNGFFVVLNYVILRSLILSLLLFPMFCQGQSFLYLKKIGGNFERRIYQTDTIKFKLKGDEYYTKGAIQSFTDSSFFVYQTEIFLKDIVSIDLNAGFYSAKLIAAGLLLPIIDIANQTYPPSSGVLIISGSLVGSGILLRMIQRKSFVPGRKYKMEVILDD